MRHLTVLSVAALATLSILASAVPAWAGCPGTSNFDNSIGTGQWNDPNNWDTNVLPGAGDDVCIGGFGVTLTMANSSIRSLTVMSTGGLAISSLGTLTLAAAFAQPNTYCEGGTGMLDGVGSSCGDSGVPSAYQWQRDGQSLDGATALTYTIPATEAAGVHD